LQEGFTYEEILKALENACNSKHHRENNLKWITPEFITRADKLQMYIIFEENENQYKLYSHSDLLKMLDTDKKVFEKYKRLESGQYANIYDIKQFNLK
jgi:hypothetical protein